MQAMAVRVIVVVNSIYVTPMRPKHTDLNLNAITPDVYVILLTPPLFNKHTTILISSSDYYVITP